MRSVIAVSGFGAFILMFLLVLALASVPEQIRLEAINPVPRDQGLFKVVVKSRGQRKAKSALLYTYYANLPKDMDELTGLQPSMLETGKIGTQKGFVNRQFGVMRGSLLFEGLIPDEIVVPLPPSRETPREIGVRVRLYRFKEGNWEPMKDDNHKALEKEGRVRVD
jgi:hypothetical protein